MSIVSDNIAKIISSGGFAHKWIHGAANETVDTDNGPVKTIAGLNESVVAEVISALSATSSSSNAISTGTKTFVIQSDKAFKAGQLVTATAANGDYVYGMVTAYSGTTLTINVLKVSGSGTKTSWSIIFSAPAGLDSSGGGSGATLLSKFDWE